MVNLVCFTCERDWLGDAGTNGGLRDLDLADVVQLTRERAARHGHAPVGQLHTVTSDHVTYKLRLVHVTRPRYPRLHVLTRWTW